MGPFTHIVDDGLNCRKAAYDCLYSLLDHCVERLPHTGNFVMHVQASLRDDNDVQLLGFMFIDRLVKLFPAILLESMSWA